jgi:hypothetical protein
LTLMNVPFRREHSTSNEAGNELSGLPWLLVTSRVEKDMFDRDRVQ